MMRPQPQKPLSDYGIDATSPRYAGWATSAETSGGHPNLMDNEIKHVATIKIHHPRESSFSQPTSYIVNEKIIGKSQLKVLDIWFTMAQRLNGSIILDRTSNRDVIAIS